MTTLPFRHPPQSHVPAVAPAVPEDAAFEHRWAAWKARGRASDASARRQARTALVVVLVAGALAGVMRLSFGAAL